MASCYAENIRASDMIQKPITIINKLGLHARAAAKFVTLASTFDCEVFLEKNGHKVNGKSIMGVMMLAASKGTEMILITDGKGENTAATKLQELIQDRFGEEE